MRVNTSRAWVPVELVRTGERIECRWMDFTAIEIAEPFFRQTIEKAARLQCNLPTTPITDLILAGAQLPTPPPACVIFHVSRCGSTLLMNALRAGGNCVALSEPKILTDLFHFCDKLISPVGELRDVIAESIVRIYASYQGGVTPIVIKLASWNLVSIHLLRQLWPKTPFVIMIRDPREVIVSNLKPGGWLAYRPYRQCAARFLQVPVGELEEMDDVGFCARFVRRLNAAVLEFRDANTIVIDYSNFDCTIMPTVIDFIDFKPTSQDWKAMQAVFATYSKDPDKTMPFHDDRLSKLQKAAHLIGKASEELAMAQYRAMGPPTRAQI